MRPYPVFSRWCLAGLAALNLLALPAALVAQDPAVVPATMNVRLADGFDFPVGLPTGEGYHKARGFTPNGHLGEDWNKDGTTGDGDLGSPIHCTGIGVVVLAANVHMGWGNVVMVRHSFREPGDGNAVHTIDSLYGHLDTILVQVGQIVAKGQLIGTMGTGGGLYDAHLHFEIRRNINIGMYRSLYARDFSNYYDPTAFIESHRQLRGGGQSLIAMNTFAPPGAGGLAAADGAYELGINRSPAKVAEGNSSKLNKSAIELQRKRTGLDKINDSYKVDRYGDLHGDGSGGR